MNVWRVITDDGIRVRRLARRVFISKDIPHFSLFIIGFNMVIQVENSSLILITEKAESSISFLLEH